VNALDFRYAEWHDKAASIVTYGTRGGGKGADQLKQVLEGLDMRGTATNPKLHTPPDSPGEERPIDELVDRPRFAPEVQAMNLELETLVSAAIS
jgi:NAD(P)H-dependent FMN reductase